MSLGWNEHLFRALVLAAMAGCLVLSPVSLVENALSSWDGTYLIFICSVVALEAYLSYYLTRQAPAYAGSRLPYLGLELAGLFCLIQLYGDAIQGQGPLQDWQPQLNPGMALSFLPVLLTWVAVRDVAHLLDLVGDHPDRASQLYVPTRRLAARFFTGGVFLFAAAGLTQVRIARLVGIPHGSDSGPIVNVLLYFLLGALMLGHVQYASLRQRWRDHEFSVDNRLAGRWMRYSLSFVAVVAFLALLLPTGHTLGLLGSSGELWTQVFGLVRDPLLRLLRLLGQTSAPIHPTQIPRNLHITPPPHLPPLHHVPPHAPGHGSTVNWGPLIQSLLFWMAVAASAVYLLRNHLQRRPRLPRTAGTSAAVLAAFSRIWSALLNWLRRSREALADRVPRGLSPGSRGPRAETNYLRLGRRGTPSPRERVLQYYLSMIRRAERQGIARRPSQTPGEFDPALVARLPDAQVDVHHLTAAFVQARYSAHQVDVEDSERARLSWHRIRAALGRLKG